MAISPAGSLALSVVMPVRNGAEFLPRSLDALHASDLPREQWELIVVDDGSGDDSAHIATGYADRLIRLPAPGGGAPVARNRGAEIARAPVIVFVDADVCVHRDALRKIRDFLEQEEGVSAVFGAYDVTPAAPGLVSQYRNLLHSYVHRRDAGGAVTFWTGLGAIRREVLEECGGFNQQERLDDVELGYRLSSSGHRIVLNPGIEGTHLKRWTLKSVIATDVMDRGVPWVRLLLGGRRPPGRATLNLQFREQVLTGLTGMALAALIIGLASGRGSWLIGSGVALAAVIVADWSFVRWLALRRGWPFAVSAISLRLLYFALNLVAVSLALVPVEWRREVRHPRPHPPGLVATPVAGGSEAP